MTCSGRELCRYCLESFDVEPATVHELGRRPCLQEILNVTDRVQSVSSFAVSPCAQQLLSCNKCAYCPPLLAPETLSRHRGPQPALCMHRRRRSGFSGCCQASCHTCNAAAAAPSCNTTK